MRAIRRLYDWVLRWAETPYGAPALFLLAFAESSFFPLPPDVLLIALCLAVPKQSLRFAGLASVGSVLGGIAGYAIGFGLWQAVSGIFFSYVPGFSPELFDRVQELFIRWDFWVVFTAGFTIIPYKIFTIGAGVFQINFFMFVLYGEGIRTFIDRYFNILTLAFMILLIASFYLVRYVF
jgi:membrane protein YqaA with SNARE-associated domain